MVRTDTPQTDNGTKHEQVSKGIYGHKNLDIKQPRDTEDRGEAS